MHASDLRQLRERFPHAVLVAGDYEVDRAVDAVVVDPAQIVEVCRFLRDEPGLAFDLCLFVSALDRLDLGLVPRFVAVYQLYSLRHNRRLRLTAPLNCDPPAIDSVSAVWPAADWHERETYDLMGIHFRGHPELRRIMLPLDWVGHPLRKDYPLGGEPVQFGVNQSHPALAQLGEQAVEEVLPQLKRAVSWRARLSKKIFGEK